MAHVMERENIGLEDKSSCEGLDESVEHLKSDVRRKKW